MMGRIEQFHYEYDDDPMDAIHTNLNIILHFQTRIALGCIVPFDYKPVQDNNIHRSGSRTNNSNTCSRSSNSTSSQNVA